MDALGKHLAVEDVLLDIRAMDRQQLFDAIGRHMQNVHGLPAESVAAALLRREQAASTALGHGVAIPHARVKALDRMRLVYVRLAPALAFDTPDGEPVAHVLALMVPEPATQAHLDVLADVVSLVSEPGFRKALQACRAPAQVKEAFDRWPH